MPRAYCVAFRVANENATSLLLPGSPPGLRSTCQCSLHQFVSTLAASATGQPAPRLRANPRLGPGMAEVAAITGPRYSSCMSTVQEIEDAVRQLTADERAAFRAWFAEFDAQEWDRQMESDVAAGKLDRLIEEARGRGRMQ